MSLQVGSGLNGPNNSYALYNTSLVDGCLQLPSPGCNRTIAFWCQVPGNVRRFLLTTTRIVGRTNPASIMGNSGILMFNVGRTLVAILYGGNASHEYITSLELIPDRPHWIHFAITYRGATDGVVYVNFEAVSFNTRTFPLSQVSAEPFMGSGISEGSTGNVTGFGTIDELLIFPDVLSPDQIAQLNQTSD